MRHWQGFFLSLFTAVLWGILPVFLTICLQVTDSSTITWYRFTFAALFVLVVLASRRALPSLRKLPHKHIWLLIAATLALVVNYVANVKGLEYINPETAQILMQLAPMLLMLGGIVLFKERFNKIEMLGAASLLIGLGLFFNDKILLLMNMHSQYALGVWVIILAAVSWAGYALTQKVLLRSLTAKQLTLLIYLLGVAMLLPFTQLADLFNMNGLQLFALLFCCLNTVFAYGAFTEALNIWHASKVSAVIALSPVFTFVSMEVAVWWKPDTFTASELDSLAYIGAAMVVGGSITAALGKGQVSR